MKGRVNENESEWMNSTDDYDYDEVLLAVV